MCSTLLTACILGSLFEARVTTDSVATPTPRLDFYVLGPEFTYVQETESVQLTFIYNFYNKEELQLSAFKSLFDDLNGKNYENSVDKVGQTNTEIKNTKKRLDDVLSVLVDLFEKRDTLISKGKPSLRVFEQNDCQVSINLIPKDYLVQQSEYVLSYIGSLPTLTLEQLTGTGGSEFDKTYQILFRLYNRLRQIEYLLNKEISFISSLTRDKWPENLRSFLFKNPCVKPQQFININHLECQHIPKQFNCFLQGDLYKSYASGYKLLPIPLYQYQLNLQDIYITDRLSNKMQKIMCSSKGNMETQYNANCVISNFSKQCSQALNKSKISEITKECDFEYVSDIPNYFETPLTYIITGDTKKITYGETIYRENVTGPFQLLLAEKSTLTFSDKTNISLEKNSLKNEIVSLYLSEAEREEFYNYFYISPLEEIWTSSFFPPAMVFILMLPILFFIYFRLDNKFRTVFLGARKSRNPSDLNYSKDRCDSCKNKTPLLPF